MAFPFFDIVGKTHISDPGRLHIGTKGATKHAHGEHAHRHHHSGRKQLLHRVSAPFLISGAIISARSENVNG